MLMILTKLLIDDLVCIEYGVVHGVTHISNNPFRLRHGVAFVIVDVLTAAQASFPHEETYQVMPFTYVYNLAVLAAEAGSFD
jgi:hypothetical protein